MSKAAWKRFAVSFLREFWHGLITHGMALGVVPPYAALMAANAKRPLPPEPPEPRLATPPPGHPERCQAEPPSEAERQLWAQLADLRVPPSASSGP